MRGVVAGGMVSALEEAKLLSSFDTIHGSSAGACAAAYFAAGQAQLGVRIFYEDINNKIFIDPLRLLQLRPVMNKDFLIDRVFSVTKPLDADQIVAEPGFLHIVTTNSKSGKGVIFDSYRDKVHLLKILKATVTMPILGGPAVEVDGLKLFDGGMVQQIPIQSALAAGATHIIALMTRRKHELIRQSRNRPFDLHREIIRIIYGDVIADLFRHRNDEINRVLNQIDLGILPNGTKLDSIVRDAGSIDFSRFTTSSTVLKRADQEARKAVRRYLQLHE
jgi:predicted patatin/cPLA2 family phospholipase